MGEIPSRQHGQEYRATTLRLEWPRRHVALVTLARPEERNAISVETIHELGEALSVAHRQRAGALVITGAGRSFCAGANLKTLASPDSPFFRDPMMFRDKFLAPLAQVLDRFRGDAIPHHCRDQRARGGWRMRTRPLGRPSDHVFRRNSGAA